MVNNSVVTIHINKTYNLQIVLENINNNATHYDNYVLLLPLALCIVITIGIMYCYYHWHYVLLLPLALCIVITIGIMYCYYHWYYVLLLPLALCIVITIGIMYCYYHWHYVRQSFTLACPTTPNCTSE